MWELEDQQEMAVDADAKAKYLTATSTQSAKEILMKETQDKVEILEKEIATSIASIEDLAQSYADLALGGSFVGQVGKSVRLLEVNLESLRNNPASDANTIAVVEKSLTAMRQKLKLLKKAAARASRQVSALRSGKVSPSAKAHKAFTILLLGGVGTGKTGVVSLFANVLQGRPLKEFEVAHDIQNEAANIALPGQSSTLTLKVYEFVSLDGVKVRIVDTPGIGDVRGLKQDQNYMNNITKALKDYVGTLNAVLVVVDGAKPHTTPSVDYALSSISTLLPQSLAENIGVLFTHVASPLVWSFDFTALPIGLQNTKQFLVDNPLALQEKIRATDPANTAVLKALTEDVDDAYESVLEAISDVFAWMDGVHSRSTGDIVALYGKARNVDFDLAHVLDLAVEPSISEGALDDASTAVGKLALTHAKLAFGGGVSDQLGKAVRVLKMRGDDLRKTGAPDASTLAEIETSRALAQQKLDALIKAEAAAKAAESRPKKLLRSIGERIGIV
jgi:GTP-binding protein EngB required for normal cell division